MTRSPLFWFVAGVGAYWGFQHFTGKGNTGKAKAQ
jgi:hypothetical protein